MELSEIDSGKGTPATVTDIHRACLVTRAGVLRLLLKYCTATLCGEGSTSKGVHSPGVFVAK